MRPSTLACAMIFSAAIFIMVHTSHAQNSPKDYVDAHNAARSKVRVGPVTWDPTVAAYAQNYARQRSGDCRLVHSDSNGRYGENLFWGKGKEYWATDAVKSWVDEGNDYSYNSNTCARGKTCGHYTQVVWRSSTRIGCARVKCRDGAVFITCNYSPPGNVNGRRPY